MSMEEVKKINYPSNVFPLDNGILYLDKIKNEITNPSQIEFLKENYIKLIGTTLWSDVTISMSYLMNDYKYIYTKYDKLTIQQVKELFNENKKFILNEINENIECVILTHHATHEICNGEYTGSKTSSAYFTYIPEIYENKNVIACINGHLHTNVNTEINGIKILSNCMGYSDEHINFDRKNAILSLI